MSKDLGEQPNSKFVLIVGSGPTNYYAIDAMYQEGAMMCFELAGEVVYACRAQEGSWAVVNRSVVGLATEADYLRFAKEDHKRETEFMRSLDPEAFKKVEEMMAKGMIGMDEEGQMVMMAPKAGMPSREPRSPEEEARLKTGQYL